jgi:predicted nucleotidyltransferase
MNEEKTIYDRTCSGFHEFDLDKHLVALVRVGSHSHGTWIPPEDPSSIDDVDVMGIVVPPRHRVLGLHHWQHAAWFDDELDITLYEWGKFIRLLLKSNPNVIGTLWLPSDCLLLTTGLWDVLIGMRDVFASQNIHDSFVGYAMAQIHKMERGNREGYMGAKRKALVEKFGYDCSNAAHAVRLLRMGTEFLETGQMNVRRTLDADELREIKRGGWTLERVKGEVDRWRARADLALQNSPLPARPDNRVAEALILLGYDWWWNPSRENEMPTLKMPIDFIA